MTSSDGVSSLVAYLRVLPGWDEAVEKLRDLAESHPELMRRAESYPSVYAGERAAMLFDVVASHRRNYQKVVLPAVARFRQRWPAFTLAALASGGPFEGLGLPPVRWATIAGVAVGLERYREERRLDAISDDVLVAHWAAATEPVRLTPRLDPYVGAVSGIGVALFAYLRMRSGADGVKPDIRVRTHLRRLGFPTPPGDVGLLLMAEAAAEELSIRRLELDQLLW